MKLTTLFYVFQPKNVSYRCYELKISSESFVRLLGKCNFNLLQLPRLRQTVLHWLPSEVTEHL